MSKSVHLMGADKGRVVCNVHRDGNGRIHLSMLQSPNYTAANATLSEKEARAIVNALAAHLPERPA